MNECPMEQVRYNQQVPIWGKLPTNETQVKQNIIYQTRIVSGPSFEWHCSNFTQLASLGLICTIYHAEAWSTLVEGGKEPYRPTW